MTANQSAALGVVRERIVGFASSRVNRATAEDLAHEVVLVLIEKYSHISKLEDLIPLSVQILKFKMLAWQRKERTSGCNGIPVEMLQIADHRMDPIADLARREKTDRFIAAVLKLGDRCRELIRLKLEGKDYEEIRLSLGARTMAAVYTWDFRCKQQIMEYLGGKL